MIKISRTFSPVKNIALGVLFALLAVNTSQAQVDPKKGYDLFKSNCKRCHYATDQKFTGPGLAGVRGRWNNDEGKLLQWVHNSAEYLKTGDKYANDLFKSYSSSQMPAFPQLSDDDIRSILAYIDDPAAVEPAPGGEAVTDSKVNGEKKETKKDRTGLILILAASAIVLVVIARALSGVSRAMDNVRREKEGEELLPEEKPFDFFVNLRNWVNGHKKLTGFVGLVAVSALLYWAFVELNTIGVYKDYQPKQPIAFSHKIHAGQNGIQCQYCHSGAEKSRHAMIPSANVCMNCHKAVSEGPTTGKKEIAKIYASIGWNPVDLKYWDNYNEMKPADVQAVFAEYLSGEEDQVAYAEVKDFIQKEIEWVQVHVLPDHAYFNHSQHVVVGKVDCKECHGEVDKMDEIKQHAKLTMGWCIDCHRKTTVQYADNKYYERLHEYYKKHYGEYEMPKGQAFTVEKIGGTECSKCHY